MCFQRSRHCRKSNSANTPRCGLRAITGERTLLFWLLLLVFGTQQASAPQIAVGRHCRQCISQLADTPLILKKKEENSFLKKTHQKLSVRRVRQDFGQIIGSHSLLLRRRIQSLLKGKTIADLLRHICIFIGGRQHPNSVSRNEWIVKRELFTDAIPPQRQRPPKKKKMKRLIISCLNWRPFNSAPLNENEAAPRMAQCR